MRDENIIINSAEPRLEVELVALNAEQLAHSTTYPIALDEGMHGGNIGSNPLRGRE